MIAKYRSVPISLYQFYCLSSVLDSICQISLNHKAHNSSSFTFVSRIVRMRKLGQGHSRMSGQYRDNEFIARHVRHFPSDHLLHSP